MKRNALREAAICILASACLGMTACGGGGSTTPIQPVKTTPSVTVTPASATVTSAQTLSVTITVGGNPTPTGSVTLGSGKYASGAASLAGG
ncbi:MAG: hypothetical protein P4L26_08490, partial [Terracidiphilus sp.]|nr:hypothetical protein [Terracidiphilus sp.]